MGTDWARGQAAVARAVRLRVAWAVATGLGKGERAGAIDARYVQALKQVTRSGAVTRGTGDRITTLRQAHRTVYSTIRQAWTFPNGLTSQTDGDWWLVALVREVGAPAALQRRGSCPAYNRPTWE